MVCGNCVQKLALRLVRNHKIDWIDGLTRAYKGILRHENNVKTVTSEEMRQLGFDPDYSASCNPTGTCTCNVGNGCVSAGDCPTGTCGCTCLPPPKPNSHYVSDTCISLMSGCLCIRFRCSGTCTCTCAGSCYYDCDEGYEWNPVTEQCELVAPPIPKAGLHPSKIIPLIIDE